MRLFHKRNKSFTVYFTDGSKMKISKTIADVIKISILREDKDWQIFFKDGNNQQELLLAIRLSAITHIK